MTSAVLFSNASFDEPSQVTVLRSLESAKRKVFEDNTLKLYESCCSKSLDKIETKESLIGTQSILGSVENYVEHDTINTIFESQPSKIIVLSDLKPSEKKRKLKIIPNTIEKAKTVDSKNKTLALMTKVSVFLIILIHFYYLIFFK